MSEKGEIPALELTAGAAGVSPVTFRMIRPAPLRGPTNAVSYIIDRPRSAPQCGAAVFGFIHPPPPRPASAVAFAFPQASFVVRLPPSRRKPRGRRPPARAAVKPDPWQPMAGRLEQVADVARQCARAARSRDPKTFDRLMDAVREALLDAIALHNTNDEYRLLQ